ncbi:MAG: hypothetical protein AAB618_02160 [Patescibacteria group bacterium]
MPEPVGKRICWVQHASEYPLFKSVAKELSDKGYQSFFVCKTRTAHKEYQESRFVSLYATDEIFSGETVTPEEYARLEKTYGLELLDKAALSDVHLLDLYPNDIKARKEVIARSFKYWEDLLSKEKVDYFILRESAMFLTRSAFYVAKQQGIPCGRLMYGPGDGLCLLSDVGELDIWSELDEAVKKGMSFLSSSQREEVEVFVASRLPKSDKKMIMRYVPESIFASFKQYSGLWWHDTKQSFRYDPIYVAALRFGRMRKEKQLLWNYVTRRLFKYADIDEKDQIVYFPTYSGLETSYLVHVPQWARREPELIIKVARALPFGYTLYVKEHPHNPGDLNFSELRLIAKEPNIKVVKPWVSSQFLIEQSKLVVTIEGTAGWEALLSKRPVLCIEDVAFYGRSSLIYKVTDISKLADIIKSALTEGMKLYENRLPEWYWFVYTVITTAGRGNTLNFAPPYGFVTDKEEAEKVAVYIDQKITRVLAAVDRKA